MSPISFSLRATWIWRWCSFRIRQAAAFFFFWDRVRQVCGCRVGPRRVLEGENSVVLGCVQQRNCVFEVRFRLAGEADDDVGGDADRAAGCADPLDLFQVLFARVGAAHFAQDARRAGLHWQMNVIAERGDFVDRFHYLAVKSLGCDVVKRTRRIPGTAATARSRSTKFHFRGDGSR